MFKLMPGSKTSAHVQIFIKLVLHLTTEQDCAELCHHRSRPGTRSWAPSVGPNASQRSRGVRLTKSSGKITNLEEINERFILKPIIVFIIIFGENVRNQASCEQARMQLAGKVVHG